MIACFSICQQSNTARFVYMSYYPTWPTTDTVNRALEYCVYVYCKLACTYM